MANSVTTSKLRTRLRRAPFAGAPSPFFERFGQLRLGRVKGRDQTKNHSSHYGQRQGKTGILAVKTNLHGTRNILLTETHQHI